MKPNITLPLSRILKGLLALSLSLCVGSTFGAASIAVTVAMSTGSVGKTYGSKIESGVLYTPCVSNTTTFGTDAKTFVKVDTAVAGRDMLTISVSITNEVDSTTKLYKWTPYVFVVNPMGTGAGAAINSYQVFVVKKYSIFSPSLSGTTGIQFIPVLTPSALLTDSTHTFMNSTDFVSTAVKEDVTGGGIFLDDQPAGSNLPQGLYYVVAILADQALVNFADPATWQAWNVAPFILGTPWAVATGGTGGNGAGDCL